MELYAKNEGKDWKISTRKMMNGRILCSASEVKIENGMVFQYFNSPCIDLTFSDKRATSKELQRVQSEGIELFKSRFPTSTFN